MREAIEQARQRLIDAEPVCPECGGKRFQHIYEAFTLAEVTRWRVGQYGEIEAAEEAESRVAEDSEEEADFPFKCMGCGAELSPEDMVPEVQQ